MTPDRIKVSAEFNIQGSGLWLAAEIPIAPGENPIEEFKKGRELLIDAFKSFISPSVTDFNTGEQIPETKVEKTIGLFKEDILSCPDIKTLETYHLLVNGKPELKEAYDTRLMQLQNK